MTRRRLGLRTKVTLASASVVLVSAVTIGIGTMVGVRAAILEEFEAGAVDQSVVNARLVARTLSTPEVDETAILAALRPPVRSRPLLLDEGLWYSASLQFRADELPDDLVAMVVDGAAAAQVTNTSVGRVLIIGIPIGGTDAAYFEVFPLTATERSLQTVARTLGIVGAGATLAGGLLARGLSRRALRPISEVTRTAERIAAGAIEARLDPRLDPDLRRLALSFNRMADSLADRIAKEARFAGDVSHELRSPLTTLSTAVTVLERRRSELSPQGREALDLLASDVARFHKTVMDLLEISRHDAGVVALEPVSMPVGEAVRLVVQRSGAGARVEVAPSAIGAVVTVDLRRLERIIGNLLDNAEAHGGGVTAVRVSVEGAVARVAVEDRGPGIGEEDRERIFDRFTRGRTTARRPGVTGSGLGLSLAVENARAMNGRLTVDPGYREGARFVLELPLEEAT